MASPPVTKGQAKLAKVQFAHLRLTWLPQIAVRAHHISNGSPTSSRTLIQMTDLHILDPANGQASFQQKKIKIQWNCATHIWVIFFSIWNDYKSLPIED